MNFANTSVHSVRFVCLKRNPQLMSQYYSMSSCACGPSTNTSISFQYLSLPESHHSALSHAYIPLVFFSFFQHLNFLLLHFHPQNFFPHLHTTVQSASMKNTSAIFSHEGETFSQMNTRYSFTNILFTKIR